MDSFELNKIAGALLAGCILLFAVNDLGYLLVKPTQLEQDAYPVAAPEEGGAAVAAKEDVPFATLLAEASVEKGAKVAKKCAGCHTFEKDGATKTGPNLYGMLGGPKAAAAGFSYSSVFQGMAGSNWDVENMAAFLENPKAYAKGTKMSFAGLKKPQQRADIIVYLNSISDTPAPLPAAQ